MARTRGRVGGLLLAAGLVLLPGLTYQVPVKGGLTRKQQHGSIHNKDKLDGVYEVADEVEQEEAAEKAPMPERRVPYCWEAQQIEEL